MGAITKLEIYGVVALILALAIGAAYLRGHHSGYVEGKQEVQTAWDNAIAAQAAKEREQSDKAVTKLETGNDKAKVVYRTITQNVDRIVEKPVYRNVCFDADGLSTANQALAGTLATRPTPDKPVPRPATPSGRNGGISVEETGRSIEPVLRLSAEALSSR